MNARDMDRDEWAWAMQEQEYEQWLRDEAAQREFQSWLDLIQLNAKDAHHGQDRI